MENIKKGHRVYIITCPGCGREKTKINLRKKLLLTYICKKCKKVYNPEKHMRKFHFRDIIAANKN